MRFLILWSLSVIFCTQLVAKNTSASRYEKQMSVGMYSLLGWSLGNILVGSAGSFSSTGSVKHFHQFNVGWNVVNLGLASSGVISLRKKNVTGMETLELFKEVNKMSKIFLFNAGLDLGYLAAAAFLNERGKARQDDRFIGFGNALMLQGGFLLVFDLLMYALVNTNRRSMLNTMSTLAPSSSGLGLVIRF